MLHVVSAAQMRELDRFTISDIGIPGAVLMETAGRRLAGHILALDAGEPIAVVCGTGNNGGDGFVCARVLREHGVHAAVYLAGHTDQVKGDAAVHLGAYRECGGVVVSVASAAELGAAENAIASASVVCDAVFGTGLSRPVSGIHADIIEVINDAIGIVVACDVPSGLDSDTGHPLGVCVRADLTVTMAFAKRGLVGEPGFTAVGDLSVVEIGIPTALGAVSNIGLFEHGDAVELLPWPLPTDHKNKRGSVLVLAGAPGQRGAGRLAARAALRTGAGLVTWASLSTHELDAPDPIMTVALTPSPGDAELAALLEGKDAIVIGPGLGTSDWAMAAVSTVLAAASVPVIVDASALRLMAGESMRSKPSNAPLILTPHPGEAAALLGQSAAEVQLDRFAAARKLAGLGSCAVLKGARTVVDDGDLATINNTGNAGMATAGAGDVLAGMIAGLAAQGLRPGDAARLGVYLHGLAGDVAASDVGPLSVTAETIIDSIDIAIGELEEV